MSYSSDASRRTCSRTHAAAALRGSARNRAPTQALHTTLYATIAPTKAASVVGRRRRAQQVDDTQKEGSPAVPGLSFVHRCGHVVVEKVVFEGTIVEDRERIREQ